MIENSGTSLRGMLEVQHDSSVILLRVDVAGFMRSWIERERDADVDVIWHPAGDGWADLPDAHMKMLANEHKPGNMAVLVQSPKTGLRTLEDALHAKK